MYIYAELIPLRGETEFATPSKLVLFWYKLSDDHPCHVYVKACFPLPHQQRPGKEWLWSALNHSTGRASHTLASISRTARRTLFTAARILSQKSGSTATACSCSSQLRDDVTGTRLPAAKNNSSQHTAPAMTCQCAEL